MTDISCLLLFFFNGLPEHLDKIEAQKGYIGICNSFEIVQTRTKM